MTKKELLNNLYSSYKDFKNTSLYIEGAQSIVFGEGNPESRIVFIGEAPGKEEDSCSRPFVGRSGRLLTSIIEECGFKRSSVFITNIVKCRPPKNRTPTKKEIEINKNLLLQYELSIIQPTIIVTLGLSSLQGLLNQTCCMKTMRTKKIKSQYGLLFPTFHPAYILRNYSKKIMLFEDIQKAFNLVNEFKITV
jgi:uracil-DNA glycosylase family 4